MNENKVVRRSIQWSGLAEIGNKLILPVSTMLLARILTPADFGVVAICNMLIFFADIISDAGFGKYLVQTDFTNDEDRVRCSNVAFWSHMALALFIWVVVLVYRLPIACVLGCAEYANIIAIACIQLVAMSVSSVPLALLRRKFEFKKIFYVRMMTAIVPLVITIPMALVLRSYWALIIGNIVSATVSAIFLLVLSKWHPKLYYSWSILHRMFSFSFWSLCEALAHWAIFWFDTFLVSHCFMSYYLGLYKNSTHIMISLFGVITATVSPVLLSVLSRMKYNEKSSFEMISNIEKLTSYLLFPIGIITYFYRQFAVMVMFGEEWIEAANIVGAWALMMVVSVVIYTFPAEAFKSRGIPKYLFCYQLSYLALLVPLCCYAIAIDFWTFVYARALGVLLQVVLFLLFFYKFIHWSRRRFIQSLTKPIVSSIVLAAFCFVFHNKAADNVWFELISLLVSLAVYLIVLFLFRHDIKSSIACIQSKSIQNG